MSDAEQTDNLERVSHRISRAVVDFVASHALFHANDLRRHVTQAVGEVAPGSADRVLRDLRQRGVIEYKVLSRSQSLYSGSVVPKQAEMLLTP